MTKDYLKFRNAIKKDENLSLEEGYMLELIFDYYNTSCQYAYPSYEVLMSDLKTKRKAKVSKLLKALVKKGYIQITKVGKKNTYKLIKYLFLNNEPKEINCMPKDSNGNKAMRGQIHYSEVIEIVEEVSETTEEENKVIDITGFTKKQASKVLNAAKNKVEDITDAFNYALSKGAGNSYKYTIWGINNIDKIRNSVSNQVQNDNIRSYVPKTKFDNFEPRHYDWGLLEKRLLGWE